MVQLAGLQTEERNQHSVNIDRVSVVELCRIINRQDAQIPKVVEACIPVIADAISALTERVRKGGRVFYIGAGTSGRLGVLDASEIPPTYSAPEDQFVALIAGGDYALRKAREGAEDSRSNAATDLQPFRLDPDVDSLIGIASSGRTPYVLGGLEYAKSLGCLTVGIVCVEPSAVGREGNVDFLIAPVTGPEVVTGSTRMKAGTATKLVLNMISTGIMIGIGKTYGNLMIDVKATNMKLRQRAKNILRFVGGKDCTQSDEELEQILEACHGSVKLAAATIVLKIPVSEAKQRLERHKGFLARVFEEERLRQTNDQGKSTRSLVLCVDAGGTSCKAVIMAPDGLKLQGVTGPCNVTTVGVDMAVSIISKAVQNALDSHEDTRGYRLETVSFSRVWVGMAGYDRPWLKPLIDTALSELFKLPLGNGLTVTSDIDILPGTIASKADVKNAIVLIAGTGSIAQSYTRQGKHFQRTARAGGWGRLLGDDGSGYAIGRTAIRKTLRMCDLHRMRKSIGAQDIPFTPLAQAVLSHFQSLDPSCNPASLLDTLLSPTNPEQNGDLEVTKKVASVAGVVLSMARDDAEAAQIVDDAAASVVDLVAMLVEGQGIDLATSGVVLGGGLMASPMYRAKVLSGIENKCGRIGLVESVEEPAVVGAQNLLEGLLDKA